MIPVIRVNGTDETAFLKKLRARASSVNDEVTASVTEIIRNVRDQGDEAVRAYTLRFDGQAPACFEVDREEINDAPILQTSIRGKSNKALLMQNKTALLWGKGSAD